MTEIDMGWEDVLRRARRRPPRRRLVLAAAVAVAALGGGPALAVLLTKAAPPQLAMDQIGTNPVHAVSDSRIGGVLLEWGKWKGHDGVCYLVPRVHADCILAGTTTQRFIPIPYLHRLRSMKPRLIIVHRLAFRVRALHGGRAELVRP